MKTTPIEPADLRRSVIAVPPLARGADGAFDREQNARILRHIESGEVTTHLYGGNANFYHLAPSEYADILSGLAGIASEDSLIIPSAGPAWGSMMDQAEVLRDFPFPTAMVLPQQGITTCRGVETGLRRFAEKLGRPIVLYLKFEGFLDAEGAARLVDDGLVSWIKYAVVREDPLNDPLLGELVDCVDPDLVVSGMGEQPVIEHLRDFRLAGFTSGCVCVRPDLSRDMLAACRDEDWSRAAAIRDLFAPLEDLRNAINPIRVLHEAVALADIAETGPHLPLLSAISDSEREAVAAAARELLALSE